MFIVCVIVFLSFSIVVLSPVDPFFLSEFCFNFSYHIYINYIKDDLPKISAAFSHVNNNTGIPT